MGRSGKRIRNSPLENSTFAPAGFGTGIFETVASRRLLGREIFVGIAGDVDGGVAIGATASRRLLEVAEILIGVAPGTGRWAGAAIFDAAASRKSSGGGAILIGIAAGKRGDTGGGALIFGAVCSRRSLAAGLSL